MYARAKKQKRSKKDSNIHIQGSLSLLLELTPLVAVGVPGLLSRAQALESAWGHILALLLLVMGLVKFLNLFVSLFFFLKISNMRI